MPSDRKDMPRFRAELLILQHERISTICIAGVVLFPLFAIMDLQFMPDQFQDMFVLRLTASFICLLTIAINKSPFGARHPFALVVVVLAALSVLVSIDTPLEVAGTSVLYFCNHILLLVGTMGILPLSLVQALVLACVCHAGFTIPTLVWATELDTVAFATQNAYLASTWLLLSISCYLDYRMREREFELRMRLYRVRQRAQANPA